MAGDVGTTHQQELEHSSLVRITSPDSTRDVSIFAQHVCKIHDINCSRLDTLRAKIHVAMSDVEFFDHATVIRNNSAAVHLNDPVTRVALSSFSH